MQSAAERQARYRQREKDRMTIVDQLIAKTHADIREWKRAVALFEAGAMHLTTNGTDRSAEQAAMFRSRITENQALVDRYDPAGALADGNLELGFIPVMQVREFWPGRPVSHEIDDAGAAINLVLFTSDTQAQSHAAGTPGRRAGRIGVDGWSVQPFRKFFIHLFQAPSHPDSIPYCFSRASVECASEAEAAAFARDVKGPLRAYAFAIEPDGGDVGPIYLS